MPELKILTSLQQITKTRPHETKLGEMAIAGDYQREEVKYVIFGIPEDIGVRANYGIGGTHTAWPAFLQAFLNIQSTASLSGSNVCLLGCLDCSALMADSAAWSIEELRRAVTLIDQEVEAIIFNITASGKLPIVIGGGHNNAYPIIKGAAKGYAQVKRITRPAINCINLDAHSDFRPIEGRHSGNGFRYAFQEGFLERYAMIGLHRNYNGQGILADMVVEDRIHYTFWESIFLEEELTFDQAVQQALRFTAASICGIELDMDGIENRLSSAMSPSGIPVTLARRFIHRTAVSADLAYLHICEGAARLENGTVDPTTGKLIAYLVSDFIRAGG